MAGGGGTRLWPLSRKRRPKQALKFFGDRTLFQVSVERGALYKNQKIILCSDGLSDEVDDEQMSEIIAQTNDDDLIVEKLVEAAINNGGKDNVSVIVISASGDAPEKPVGESV